MPSMCDSSRRFFSSSSQEPAGSGAKRSSPRQNRDADGNVVGKSPDPRDSVTPEDIEAVRAKDEEFVASLERNVGGWIEEEEDYVDPAEQWKRKLDAMRGDDVTPESPLPSDRSVFPQLRSPLPDKSNEPKDGFLTAQQTLALITLYKTDPERYDTGKLAENFKVDERDVELMLQHCSIPMVYRVGRRAVAAWHAPEGVDDAVLMGDFLVQEQQRKESEQQQQHQPRHAVDDDDDGDLADSSIRSSNRERHSLLFDEDEEVEEQEHSAFFDDGVERTENKDYFKFTK